MSLRGRAPEAHDVAISASGLVLHLNAEVASPARNDVTISPFILGQEDGTGIGSISGGAARC